MSNKVLLTGAGFSYNVGFPLARQVWGLIFNDPDIQSMSSLRKELLENYNYEDLYSKVLMNEHYLKCKEPFKKKISDIFNIRFEEICLKAIDGASIGSIEINYQDLYLFIKKFSHKNNYLFTTNQDLFLERLFIKNKDMLASPYVGNCLWNYNHNSEFNCLNNTISALRNIKEFENEEYFLPTQSELLEIKKGNKFCKNTYYKLHGSIGWESKNHNAKDTPLVMGTNKSELIQSEPVFTEYLKVFEAALCQDNASLLVIGYSFSDKHINKIILKAAKQHKLKIHVLSPTPVDDFKSDLSKEIKFGCDSEYIYEQLYGYYESMLENLFPINDTALYKEDSIRSKSEDWMMLNKNFFNSGLAEIEG